MIKDKLENYKVQKVKISDLEFDPNNPNKMTPEQIEGLKESFKTWGKLVPITVTEKRDGKYKIGDGEHRAQVLAELGEKEIEAYIVPKINDDIQRKLMRQTFNKLRGEHDLLLDIQEMGEIFSDDKGELLSILIAKPQDELRKLLEQSGGGEDFDDILKENEGINYFTYQFHFEESQREFVDTHLAEIKKQDKLASNGDIFIRLCEIYDKSVSKQKPKSKPRSKAN